MTTGTVHRGVTVNRGDLVKTNKNKLPSFVCELMKPSFECLADESQLSKCLHRGTQNANEAFHHFIWSKCLKEVLCGRKQIEFAVATTVFNEGQHGIDDMFNAMGLSVGYHHVTSGKTDNKRLIRAEQAIQDNA